MWDTQNAQIVAGSFQEQAMIASVASSTDGSKIVSVSVNGQIRAWDVQIGQVVSRLFEGHTGFITFVPSS